MQKSRNIANETEESGDELLNKKPVASFKKRFEKVINTTEAKANEDLLMISNQKNSLQSNSKKIAKRNSIPKVESICLTQRLQINY